MDAWRLFQVLGHVSAQRLERATAVGEWTRNLVLVALVLQVIWHLKESDEVS